jgi:hypothetical protein
LDFDLFNMVSPAFWQVLWKGPAQWYSYSSHHDCSGHRSESNRILKVVSWALVVITVAFLFASKAMFITYPFQLI